MVQKMQIARGMALAWPIPKCRMRSRVGRAHSENGNRSTESWQERQESSRQAREQPITILFHVAATGRILRKMVNFKVGQTYFEIGATV